VPVAVALNVTVVPEGCGDGTLDVRETAEAGAAAILKVNPLHAS